MIAGEESRGRAIAPKAPDPTRRIERRGDRRSGPGSPGVAARRGLSRGPSRRRSARPDGHARAADAAGCALGRPSRPRSAARSEKRCEAEDIPAPNGVEPQQPHSPKALYPKTLSAMIELINFTKRYGDLLAVDQLNLKIEAGRDVRLHRSQRRRQEHDDPLPGHAAEGHQRRRDRQRPSRQQGSAGRAPQRRLHARQLRRLRRHEGLGVPRLLRRGLPASPRPAASR